MCLIFSVEFFINSSMEQHFVFISFNNNLMNRFYVSLFLCIFIILCTKDKISSILMCILFIRWYLVCYFLSVNHHQSKKKNNNSKIHDQFRFSIRPPRAVSQQIADIYSFSVSSFHIFNRHTDFMYTIGREWSVELILTFFYFYFTLNHFQ